MTSIDRIYALVALAIVTHLESLGEPGSDLQHWLVVIDAIGVDLVDAADTPLSPSEVLASLVDKGIEGAAYITHIPGPPERVLAQVLVDGPRNSDVRESQVLRSPGSGVELSPWEYTM